MSGHAVFPGTFDPLTVAHVAIADAVHDQLGVSTVDLAISRVALAKEDVSTPVDDRVDDINRLRHHHPWLRGTATDAQLVADIAVGYDVVVIGADKWDQLLDSRFYGGPLERDAALARLPRLAIAPRAGWKVPPADSMPSGREVHVLSLPPEYLPVSSTAVRRGRREWRAPRSRRD